MPSERFAGRLKELRIQAGLSQKELADRAGLALSAIGHLEQGLRSPSWETVLALCDALGVSCEDFKAEPQSAPPAGRGRPRKESAPTEDKPAADRPASKAKRKKEK